MDYSSLRRATEIFRVGIFIFLCLFVVLGCKKGISEEDKLRGIVHEVAEAAQKKDIAGVRRHISMLYKDMDGNDYNSVKAILLYHFLRAEKISVFVRSVTVEIKGDTAVVQANAVLVRGKEVKSIQDIIPESSAGYRFDVIFKKEKNEWKCVNAGWKDVGVAGLL